MSTEVLGFSTETWGAIGSAATAGGFLLAGFAAAVAALQLRYSEQSRIDQNRPYVLVTLEQGLTWMNSIDILVRNIGAGPARDVRIVVDPPLERTHEEPDMRLANTRFFNETIPLMPPGFELRTYFDDLITRKDSGLPVRYEFTISYNDGHGHNWSETTFQDIEILNNLLFTEVFSIHDVAKALAELTKTVKAMPLTKGPLEVMTEPRAERVERLRVEGEARKALFEERKGARLSQQQSDPEHDGHR